MAYDREFLQVDLAKKAGQVKKHKTVLETKQRKNRKRESEKVRLYGLIKEAERKIQELKNQITYYENLIPERKKKLDAVLPSVDVTEEENRVNRFQGEYDAMVALAFQIETLMDNIERWENQGTTDETTMQAYRQTLDQYIEDFKKVKGRGF